MLVSGILKLTLIMLLEALCIRIVKDNVKFAGHWPDCHLFHFSLNVFGLIFPSSYVSAKCGGDHISRHNSNYQG